MKNIMFLLLCLPIFKIYAIECKTDEDRQKGCIEVKKVFDENTKQMMKSETPYKNGVIHGIQKIYYENERLQSEIKFKKGIPMIGNFFYKNGKLKEILQTSCLTEDECVVKITSARDDSYYERKIFRKQNEVIWDNKIQTYYSDGGLHEIIEYDGEKIKKLTLFFPNGDLAKEEERDSNNVVTIKQYDKNGKPLFTLKANLDKDDFIFGQCANGKKMTIAHYLRIKKAKGLVFSVCQ